MLTGNKKRNKDMKRVKTNFEYLCNDDKILVFFKKSLNKWNQELDEMTEAEKRTAKGKSMVATFKQCARYLNPLFKFCRKKLDCNNRNGCEGFHDHTDTEHRCGRPLGMDFDENSGDLYIADAYLGLLVVGPNGGLAAKVAKMAAGVPFGFTNSLCIDQTHGVIYFTDSSTTFSRRGYVSVIVSGDNTGRLMKYDMQSKLVSVLLKNLKFPNGVALSKHGDFLLFAETTTCKIFKFWLKTSQAGSVEVVSELPGFPDNIKRNKNGEFWVGVNSRRSKFLDWFLSKTWIRNYLAKMPFDITKSHSFLASLGFGGGGLAVRLSEDGHIVEILEDSKGKRWKFVSEVNEINGNLWFGSVKMPFAIKEKMAS